MALEPVGRFLAWLFSFFPDAAYARFLLWTVIPFFWMITASLKTNKEIYGDFTILPQSLYFGHYVTLLSGKFSIWMRNSAEVSLAATTLSITLGALGAWQWWRR